MLKGSNWQIIKFGNLYHKIKELSNFLSKERFSAESIIVSQKVSWSLHGTYVYMMFSLIKRLSFNSFLFKFSHQKQNIEEITSKSLY